MSRRRGRPQTQKREVFGFLCDVTLAHGFRGWARTLGVPIFTLVEHALQIGFVVLNLILAKDPEKEAEVIEELTEHLRTEHSLKPELENSDYEHRLIRNLIPDSPRIQGYQQEVLDMLAHSEELGIPPEITMLMLRKFFKDAWDRLEEALARRKLTSKVRFGTVAGFHRKYPDMMTEILNAANEHGIEELARVLGIKLDTVK